MREYSEEYKRDLKDDYEYLTQLVKEISKQPKPYTEEEERILSDFDDVQNEYWEVFGGAPKKESFIGSFFNKIKEKRKLPASQRKPIYCNNVIQIKRVINLDDYTKLR